MMTACIHHCQLLFFVNTLLSSLLYIMQLVALNASKISTIIITSIMHEHKGGHACFNV